MSQHAGLARLGADELWRHIRAAAAGTRSGGAAIVARQCVSGESVRLGWVHPPPWSAIDQRVSAIRAGLGPPAGHGLLVLATGGWSFAAQALRETAWPPGAARRLTVLDSLEPAAISAALGASGRRPDGYLAISGSGGTVETRQLAGTVLALAGHGRARLVWLRDRAAPPGAFALSPRGACDQVAMLGAPLSMAFLFPAATMDRSALATAYCGLRQRYLRIGADAARRAACIAPYGTPRLHIALPPWAGRGLRLWVLQLGRQVLCGKSARFRPWVDVTGTVYPPPRGADVSLDLSGVRSGLSGLMEIMYTAGLFTGCLALRAGVQVAEHHHVRAYKELLAGADADDASPGTAAPADLPALAAGWLAGRAELTRLHVVLYDSRAAGPGTLPERFTAATGRPCEVHAGSAWNHHSFHAVYADLAVAVLLVVAPPGRDAGLTTQATAVAARTLRRIAVATHQALRSRSMVVQLSSLTVPARP